MIGMSVAVGRFKLLSPKTAFCVGALTKTEGDTQSVMKINGVIHTASYVANDEKAYIIPNQ